jgi:hypothetical protein
MNSLKTLGYKNQDKFFHNDDALTLTFYKVNIPPSLEEAACLEKHKRHSSFCRLHPYYVRDISILYRNFQQEDEDFMLSYLQKLAGKLIIRVVELKELRCEYQGRHNRMYRLYWQSCSFPLSRQLFNEFHSTIEDCLSMTQQLIMLSFLPT